MSERPLLMIPGPIEVSPAVVAAASIHPDSHMSPAFVATFGAALKSMRHVWRAGPDAQPFVLAGSGTLAMEMAATNLLDPGERALVVHTGYFSARMAEMLRRRGVEVSVVAAPPGDAPDAEAIEEALRSRTPKAVFATHVDTSTGVRIDAEAIAAAARAHGALSVFDGVCATAGERFEMASWGADVYLTASQKAIGAPAGLALLVVSARALEARAALKVAPPLTLDFEAWRPIMQGYEQGAPRYFGTPATTLVPALKVSLDEVLGDEPTPAMEARFERHAAVARGFRAGWAALGLELLPRRRALAANTLSAVYFPEAIEGSEVLKGVKARGVVVAGGLLPELKTRYFRVGHMGAVVDRPADLERTLRAVAESLTACGHAADVDAALAAASAEW